MIGDVREVCGVAAAYGVRKGDQGGPVIDRIHRTQHCSRHIKEIADKDVDVVRVVVSDATVLCDGWCHPEAREQLVDGECAFF